MVATEPDKKSPTKRSPLTCHHCGISGNIRPMCPQLQAQKSKVKKE
jgi:ribosome modulation factor